MKIGELNSKYFELYGDLFAARQLMPSRQYDSMYRALFAQYQEDLRMCVDERFLETSRQLFELRFKRRNYAPRRFLFWQNRMAKALTNQLQAEFLAELEAMQQVAAEPDEGTCTYELQTDEADVALPTIVEPTESDVIPTE